MANEDFLSLSIKDVELFWPKVDQPYRYDKMKGKSEPCSPEANNAQYSVAFEMDKAQGKALFDALKAHYAKCRSRNQHLPEFSTVFGMKRDDAAGTVRFTAKRNAKQKDGKLSKPPQVVQAGTLAPLEDKAIWSGSFGGLSVSAFPTIDPDNRGGISLGLNAVIVKNAVYGGNSLESEFGDYGMEGGFEVERASDDAPPAHMPPPAARAAAPAPLPDDAW